MRLLLVRHGNAEDPESFISAGKPDDLRPLTPEGLAEMELVSRGIQRLLPHIDLLASSPLVRARETAGVIAATYGGLEFNQLSQLTPEGRPQAFRDWLRVQNRGSVIVAVGHQPSLGDIIGLLVTGTPAPIMQPKKASATLLEISQPTEPRATLSWSLTASQLVLVARSR
jgi:phosphohistidine phosphatase